MNTRSMVPPTTKIVPYSIKQVLDLTPLRKAYASVKQGAHVYTWYIYIYAEPATYEANYYYYYYYYYYYCYYY